MAKRRRRYTDSYETLEEAIRVLLSELEPGTELWIHHEDCAIIDGASEMDCTCIPRRLRREGAQA